MWFKLIWGCYAFLHVHPTLAQILIFNPTILGVKGWPKVGSAVSSESLTIWNPLSCKRDYDSIPSILKNKEIPDIILLYAANHSTHSKQVSSYNNAIFRYFITKQSMGCHRIPEVNVCIIFLLWIIIFALLWNLFVITSPLGLQCPPCN